MTKNEIIKPRIKRRYSILWKSWVWECTGLGKMGMMDTPNMAYWSWRSLIEK